MVHMSTKHFSDETILQQESYKTLRTNLLFCGDDKKIILVTSCIPGEGKSSISLRLAFSLAQAGKKILFIDGDMRKSMLYGKYKGEKILKGLSHYLAGQNSAAEVIQKTDVERLEIVLPGPVPANPAELLEGNRLKDFMKKVEKEYQYIIVDSPPVGSVTDSSIIARVCDGVVFVVQANAISYKFARKIKQQIERTGCPLIGAVLNKVAINASVF